MGEAGRLSLAHGDQAADQRGVDKCSTHVCEWLDRDEPAIAEARAAAAGIVGDVSRTSEIINHIGGLFQKAASGRESMTSTRSFRRWSLCFTARRRATRSPSGRELKGGLPEGLKGIAFNCSRS